MPCPYRAWTCPHAPLTASNAANAAPNAGIIDALMPYTGDETSRIASVLPVYTDDAPSTTLAWGPDSE